MKRVFVIGLAIAGTIGISTSAISVPVPNQQGDYPITSFNSHTSADRQAIWQVFDNDPRGVNCRMAKQFQAFGADSMNMPDAFYQRNNISQWEVIAVFRRGQRIQVVTGNRGQIVITDNRGKPWLPIRVAKGDCLVRANSRFIRPVNEIPRH